MHVDVMINEFIAHGVELDGLKVIAKKVIDCMGSLRICIFRGEMGSGKTTFIKALGEVLKVNDTMSSPSFSIINEYHTKSGDPFYHFDFYRIKSVAEAYDTGAEEYFNTGNYCFVEWPEKIEPILPDAYAQVAISVDDNTHRTLEFTIHG